MIINDAHCHFFSTPFFAALGGDAALKTLAWEAPGRADELADRWVAELDRHHVSRAAVIASMPGDAESVGAAARRHPSRLVGFFMVDPTQATAVVSAACAIDRDGLRTICLFPAMHRYPLHDERLRRVLDVAAGRPGTAVFVHCGVLSVGLRRQLGQPSLYDLRLCNPIDPHANLTTHSSVPIITHT